MGTVIQLLKGMGLVMQKMSAKKREALHLGHVPEGTGFVAFVSNAPSLMFFYIISGFRIIIHHISNYYCDN